MEEITDPKLREMVQRIVQTVDPDRVILFGSRARGEARPDSDYDLLIVVPSALPDWKRPVPVYRAIGPMGVSKDIVWWTQQEIDEWRNVKSHFITTVLREGRVVYERPQ